MLKLFSQLLRKISQKWAITHYVNKNLIQFHIIKRCLLCFYGIKKEKHHRLLFFMSSENIISIFDENI